MSATATPTVPARDRQALIPIPLLVLSLVTLTAGALPLIQHKVRVRFLARATTT